MLLLREKLVAEQRMDEVRILDKNLFLTPHTVVEHDGDDDDDKYSLLSPKERLRCVSEMEKSVDSLAVNADSTSGYGSNTELMLRCVKAMQSKRLIPSCLATAAASSEVTLRFLSFCYMLVNCDLFC